MTATMVFVYKMILCAADIFLVALEIKRYRNDEEFDYLAMPFVTLLIMEIVSIPNSWFLQA